MGADGHGSGQHALGTFQERTPHYLTTPPDQKPPDEKLPAPRPLGEKSVTPARLTMPPPPPPPAVPRNKPALLPAVLTSPVTLQAPAALPARDAEIRPVGNPSTPVNVAEPEWNNTSQATPGSGPALGAVGPTLKPEVGPVIPANENTNSGSVALFRRSF